MKIQLSIYSRQCINSLIGETFLPLGALDGLEGKIGWERLDGLSASIPPATRAEGPPTSWYRCPTQEVRDIPKSHSSLEDRKMQISLGRDTPHAIVPFRIEWKKAYN